MLLLHASILLRARRIGRSAERFAAPEQVSLFVGCLRWLAACAARMRLGLGRSVCVLICFANARACGVLGALLSVLLRPKKFLCFWSAFVCSVRASLTAPGPRVLSLCVGMTLFHIHAHTLRRVSLPSRLCVHPKKFLCFLGAFACSPRALLDCAWAAGVQSVLEHVSVD